MGKEKKIIGVGTVSFNIGIFTMLYSWLLAAFFNVLVQEIFSLNIGRLFFIPFQIIAAFLGNIFAIKQATKGISINGTLLTTIFLSVFISLSVITTIQMLIGFDLLVPFNSILGLVIILIIYIISSYFSLKKVFE